MLSLTGEGRYGLAGCVSVPIVSVGLIPVVATLCGALSAETAGPVAPLTRPITLNRLASSLV